MPHDVLASEAGAWSPLHHYFIADKILYVKTFNWFKFIDHLMFLLLKPERGHLFHHLLIPDQILYVETFNWFQFIDHLMFLLLKPERGHLFRHYFNGDKILSVETFHWFYFFTSYDVLVSGAGAWSSLSLLLQSRQKLMCRKTNF